MTIAKRLEITDDELALKLARVFYVVQLKRSEPYHYVHGLDPTQNFNVGHRDSNRLQRADGLVAVDKITTYHQYGYHGFFKPSLKEVLAQIPFERIEREGIVAFEGGTWDMHNETDFVTGETIDSYHKMDVTLFRLEKDAPRPDPNYRKIRKLVIEAAPSDLTREDSGAGLTVAFVDHEDGQPIFVRLISSQYEDIGPGPSQVWDDHKDLRDLISTGRVKITIEALPEKKDAE